MANALRYMLPSSPCSICLPSGYRYTAHDGIVDLGALPERVRAEAEEHLEDMCAIGNASRVIDGDAINTPAPAVALPGMTDLLDLKVDNTANGLITAAKK